ncbi:protein translocase subunit SecD [Acetobacteraceae bacterium]|nr:protein translocase subunit SecD [Candidatus Parcubacteria bacterium]
MFRLRYAAVVILIAAGLVGYFVYATTGTGGRFDFKLGLDLSGGTHLVYSADVSALPAEQVADSLATLREVIERRVNAFGVGEPIVQTEQGGALGGGEHRLIVELPGITDVDEAVKMIGATPLLEFKLVKQGFENNLELASTSTTPGAPLIPNPDAFEETGLTGKYLSRAALEFGNGGALVTEPTVRVDFNAEGTQLFSDITSNNVNRPLGIFLDGRLVSSPTIREAITDGTAIISGNFNAESARELVRNLNLGALPVPIVLSSTQTIGATLGDEAVRAGILAGIVGFLALCAFMILWYRLPGVIAVVSLLIYIVLMLALFKLIPVVLTAAGIAGFILSVGLAVDANVLIAERLKEELAAGKKTDAAIREGFARAWLAIRDSNIAHIIAGVILFWFGTSLIKGFALVFGLGVLVSMLSAITISRTFLLALGISAESKFGHFLLRSGLRK